MLHKKSARKSLPPIRLNLNECLTSYHSLLNRSPRMISWFDVALLCFSEAHEQHCPKTLVRIVATYCLLHSRNVTLATKRSGRMSQLWIVVLATCRVDAWRVGLVQSHRVSRISSNDFELSSVKHGAAETPCTTQLIENSSRRKEKWKKWKYVAEKFSTFLLLKTAVFALF